MNFGLGTMMQIGFRLINNRQQIMDVWTKVAPLVNDAIRVAPQLKDLIDQVAPEVLQARHVVEAQTPTFDMAWLQTGLNTVNNAGLTVDGDYGPMTKAAIENFQRQNGLTVDGWAGAATSAALTAALTKIGKA